MHRRADTYDFDIPKDDVECWDRYPKHRWVYELSRLLDAQNIKWSPFKTKSLTDEELNINLISTNTILYQPGVIYLKRPNEQCVITEIYIMKGEIKMMHHLDSETGKELPSMIGEVELRLNAFITLYFQKFTGVISTDTYANEIFRIRLRPYVEYDSQSDIEIMKLIKRIYKKTDITLSGPADRVLHETLAS